ncbi:MAG TPA: WYL domain-containing protein, partial [Paracoccaceae bacterium]|nr:WYL domain-containing protein [Paracoccaceae bacterium]
PEARKLADAPYFSLRRPTGAPRHAGLIREAIRKRHIVLMTYADGEGQRSTRSVHPLAIWNLADGWMFSGWCELRRGFRTFRFDRIAQLAVTDANFPDSPAKGLRAFLEADHCKTRAP